MTTSPLRRPSLRPSSLLLAAAALSPLLVSCGNTFPGSEDPETPTPPPPPMVQTEFTDFPKEPILDTPMMGMPLPADIGDQFGDVSKGAQSGGPCVLEPETGSLFPNNWLRPRFRFRPAMGQG